MKRMLLGAVAALGLIGTAAAQAPAALPPGPKVNVVAVTQPLPTQPQFTRVDVPVLREGLAQRSGGRIEVQLSTHAERNLSGTELVRLVRSGQADIAAATLTTLSGDVPILDGVDLAGLAPDIALAKRIAEAMLPVVNRDLERFGARLMVIYPFPAQVVFCRAGFTSLADLRGRKVRTFGNSLVDFFTALGAQPVSIGFPEVYSALERGVVDCAITGTGSGVAARWPEVTTHVSNLPVSWALAGYMVNVAWWNRLDPQVRAMIEGALREVNEKQWELGAAATRDGLDCAIGNAAACHIHTLSTRPMTEVPATPADQAALREILEKTVLPGFVRRCGARCGEVFNQVIAPVAGVRFGG
ncbi:TRAP transporter substrate-binding protein [Siccirubricoccus sp. KC 17139]|uniref:TRAP transporter substrate-binding protein n=1 Tax=Siccirubricoccus soli TaxID=2899147 RepID=A0ABT1D609_9PROT|nr:TRAP transporter substrate-binding protein [Siccirubricoccus soli]MCO6417366.1 TRAP transporter substrate-binding protein [Siccirubricoccus soli]MCP2683501.1 TRAP transporter substrate-binding protein [Siccirubricoccus soli]